MSDSEFRGPWWDGPTVLAGEALDDWVDVLRACRPWSRMPLDDVTGEFRSVLEALLAPAPGEERGETARMSQLRRAARAHGAFRRRQGCQALVLREEIESAEKAIEIALARGGAPPSLVTTIQDSLAPVMRSIERAAYSGYVDWVEYPGQGP